MRNKILQEIKQAQCITIFRHQFPDMDAIGSQFGLATWIKETYRDKKVYCLGSMGTMKNRIKETTDEVSDEVIASSLAIILDTANCARIDDQRFKFAQKSIRIDHHVQIETVAHVEWIDAKATATCEMISLMLAASNIQISSKSAQYLYCGMIADNIRFSISNVRQETFEAAKYLLSCGVDIVEANAFNFSTKLVDFKYETAIRNKAIVQGKSMTSIMEIADYIACDQTFASAKEKVYALSGVDEITIWALFTRMEDGIYYSASLRSKTLNVREIAEQFGGGGHICASGIKNITDKQVVQIQQLLKMKSLESN